MLTDKLKRIMAFLLVFILLFHVTSPVLLAMIALPGGTPVQLELTETISSKTATVGQGVKFKVSTDVIKNGKVVIKGGSIALGNVISVSKTGVVGKPGSLGIQIKSVTAVDGTIVPLSASRVIEGESKETTALVVTLILCIFGIFIKGEDASLQAGSVFEATTMTEVNVNVE